MSIVPSNQQELLAFLKQDASEQGNLSIRGVARMVGVAHQTIHEGLGTPSGKLSQKLIGQGFNPSGLCTDGFSPQAVILVLEYYAYESKAKAPMAKQLMRTFGTIGLMETLKNIRQPQPEPKQSLVAEPLSFETIANCTSQMSQCAEQFEKSGDLQLAQLIKTTMGNQLLILNQNLLKPVEVEEYEGCVDVAIRLGFAVPSNYEGSLGAFVQKQCGHLMIGQNNRYSTASHKKVPAFMYPAKNQEVEQAVTSYCVSKSFKNRNVSLMD
jgi:hypothetical protein